MGLLDFTAPESGSEKIEAFDMSSLKTHLPQKRGLSKYFSGKSRSFQCMADATCVEDLKKPELPIAKRRKYSKRKTFIPPVRCAPCVGV